jgi:hypothetical protein
LKSSLLGANEDTQFRINVIDWDANSSHDPIGHILISFKQFAEAAEKRQPLKILHYKGKAKDVGTLDLAGTTVQKLPSFMDFLQGGLEMKMFVAVDFTGSNGDPRAPNSLHFMRPGAFNEYQQAIVSVGEILSNYDQLRQFACYGFGGVVNRVVSHCFALNGNPANPVVNGVQGMLDACAAPAHRARMSLRSFAIAVTPCAATRRLCSTLDYPAPPTSHLSSTRLPPLRSHSSKATEEDSSATLCCLS